MAEIINQEGPVYTDPANLYDYKEWSIALSWLQSLTMEGRLALSDEAIQRKADDLEIPYEVLKARVVNGLPQSE